MSNGSTHPHPNVREAPTRLPRGLYKQSGRWGEPVEWGGGPCPVPDGTPTSVWRGRWIAEPQREYYERKGWSGCWSCLNSPEMHDWSTYPDGEHPILLYRVDRPVSAAPFNTDDLRAMVKAEVRAYLSELLAGGKG